MTPINFRLSNFPGSFTCYPPYRMHIAHLAMRDALSFYPSFADLQRCHFKHLIPRLPSSENRAPLAVRALESPFNHCHLNLLGIISLTLNYVPKHKDVSWIYHIFEPCTMHLSKLQATDSFLLGGVLIGFICLKNPHCSLLKRVRMIHVSNTLQRVACSAKVMGWCYLRALERFCKEIPTDGRFSNTASQHTLVTGRQLVCS